MTRLARERARYAENACVKVNILLKLRVLCKLYRCRKNDAVFVCFAQAAGGGEAAKNRHSKGCLSLFEVNQTYLLVLSREKSYQK